MQGADPQAQGGQAKGGSSGHKKSGKQKNKNSKPLNTNFGSKLLKLTFVIVLIEGYFLVNYLLSF